MRAIPKSVTVAPHRYSVEVKRLDDCWGRVILAEGRIEMSDALSLERQWEVLGHEIVHACFEMAGLNGEKKVRLTVEQICCLVGHQIGTMLGQEATP